MLELVPVRLHLSESHHLPRGVVPEVCSVLLVVVEFVELVELVEQIVNPDIKVVHPVRRGLLKLAASFVGVGFTPADGVSLLPKCSSFVDPRPHLQLLPLLAVPPGLAASIKIITAHPAILVRAALLIAEKVIPADARTLLGSQTAVLHREKVLLLPRLVF